MFNTKRITRLEERSSGHWHGLNQRIDVMLANQDSLESKVDANERRRVGVTDGLGERLESLEDEVRTLNALLCGEQARLSALFDHLGLRLVRDLGWRVEKIEEAKQP